MLKTYLPYLQNHPHHAEFCSFFHYTRRNQITFIIADSSQFHDIIFFNAASKVIRLPAYIIQHHKFKTLFKIVGKMIFSLIFFKTIIKRIGRFLIGSKNWLILNYQKNSNKLIEILDYATYK